MREQARRRGTECLLPACQIKGKKDRNEPAQLYCVRRPTNVSTGPALPLAWVPVAIHTWLHALHLFRLHAALQETPGGYGQAQ